MSQVLILGFLSDPTLARRELSGQQFIFNAISSTLTITGAIIPG